MEVCSYFFCFFFFFKQKTAYEMRISDWSSDVCSSDLTLRLNAAHISTEIVLLPIVTRFLAANPGVSVEIVIDNSLSDMVSEGFDAGVRLDRKSTRLNSSH